jgi:phospholipid/cholesterol/gamma-HCH transport system substrate-binding protein
MERTPLHAPLIKHLDFKVGLLLAVTLFLALTFILFAMHARGVFSPTQSLILVAENAEGVNVGMKMTFSGFPIAQIKRMILVEDGKVRLELEVPSKDARWLRESSIFTLERSLLGGAKLRAYSTNFNDPPLPDGAERDLLIGDALEEINGIIQRVRGISANLEDMTTADSSLNRSLKNVDVITQRMTGSDGVLGGLLGDPEHSRKVIGAIDRANTLLTSMNGVSLRLDGMLSQADRQLFSDKGVMPEAQRAMQELNRLLGETRGALAQADTILREAQTTVRNVNAITQDVKGATADLDALREDVDTSVRQIDQLIDDINRILPFSRDAEISLP